MPDLVCGFHQTVDAELDGGGVDRSAVVERHVLAELEGVGEVIGDTCHDSAVVSHEHAVKA